MQGEPRSCRVRKAWCVQGRIGAAPRCDDGIRVINIPDEEVPGKYGFSDAKKKTPRKMIFLGGWPQRKRWGARVSVSQLKGCFSRCVAMGLCIFGPVRTGAWKLSLDLVCCCTDQSLTRAASWRPRGAPETRGVRTRRGVRAQIWPLPRSTRDVLGGFIQSCGKLTAFCVLLGSVKI